MSKCRKKELSNRRPEINRIQMNNIRYGQLPTKRVHCHLVTISDLESNLKIYKEKENLYLNTKTFIKENNPRSINEINHLKVE